MLNHIFTTPVIRVNSNLTPEQLSEIAGYMLELRASSPGEERSNRGGWHSKGNLFAAEHKQFGFMREAVTNALFGYIGEVFGYRGEIELALTGWTVVNRAGGDFNVPHNHAANMVSGAFYVTVPGGMTGGEIMFQDPRLNLNAYQTEGMRRLNIKPPWFSTNITVQPAAGEILIFPSWLVHWVNPFQCEERDAVRIVVSFNASV